MVSMVHTVTGWYSDTWQVTLKVATAEASLPPAQLTLAADMDPVTVNAPADGTAIIVNQRSTRSSTADKASTLALLLAAFANRNWRSIKNMPRNRLPPPTRRCL